MSLISFVKKIITGIESLFNGLPAELKTAIAVGVTLTENLKTIMASPVVDVITAIIPGQADDAAVALLRAALPKIMTQLQLTQNCINSSDPNTIVQCGLQTLSKLDAGTQNSFLHSISIMLAQVAADGKLAWSDGVYLLQWFYTNVKKTA